jgi:hypothetical protein
MNSRMGGPIHQSSPATRKKRAPRARAETTRKTGTDSPVAPDRMVTTLKGSGVKAAIATTQAPYAL